MSKTVGFLRSHPEVVASGILFLFSTSVTFLFSIGWSNSLVAENIGELPQPSIGTFFQITIRNCLVMLGLFSGVVTFGVSTVTMLLVVGMLIGWSMGISVGQLGLVDTFLRAWAYTPLEFAAFILAGSAGLLPASNSLSRRPSKANLFPAALNRLRNAFMLLVAAGVVETLSIAIVKS